MRLISRHRLLSAITMLIAFAFVTAGAAHSVSRADLDPNKAFVIALSGADALCGDEQPDGQHSGTCSACVLAKSISVPVDATAPALIALDLSFDTSLLPRGVGFHSLIAAANAAIRAPPQA